MAPGSPAARASRVCKSSEWETAGYQASLDEAKVAGQEVGQTKPGILIEELSHIIMVPDEKKKNYCCRMIKYSMPLEKKNIRGTAFTFQGLQEGNTGDVSVC